MIADHTDVSEDDHHESGEHELPPRPVDKGKKPLGRKLKDKLTGTTHEQRVRERQRRDEEERRMYEQHVSNSALGTCISCVNADGSSSLHFDVLWLRLLKRVSRSSLERTQTARYSVANRRRSAEC